MSTAVKLERAELLLKKNWAPSMDVMLSLAKSVAVEFGSGIMKIEPPMILILAVRVVTVCLETNPPLFLRDPVSLHHTFLREGLSLSAMRF